MDRRDEFDPDVRDVERVSSREQRTGDILGLGGAPVPRSPDDPSVERDPEAAATRVNRIFSVGDDDERPSGRTPKRTAGATGIGDDGTRTDVSDE
jgi:hypothetical protein